MRRRNNGGSSGDLRESLLQHDEEPSSNGRAQPPVPHHQQQIIQYQPFSMDAFVRWVVASWLGFLGTLSSCLQALLGGGGGSFSLSLVQAERLEELQERLAVAYNPQDAQHTAQLAELWALGFPGTPCPPGLKAEAWKQMGWQSDDPARDFRGAGLFGLDNLLHLGTHHPSLFQQLMHKSRGVRSSFEYPFAAGGLNLTWQLAEVLGVHASPGTLPKTAAGRAFCALLSESDAAFEEVYCAAYALLDRVWLARGASYMEFNAVMKEVKDAVAATLRRRPASLAQLTADIERACPLPS